MLVHAARLPFAAGTSSPPRDDKRLERGQQEKLER